MQSLKSLALVLFVKAGLVSVAGAALLAVEPFNYPDRTNWNGLTGGKGWQGAWTGQDTLGIRNGQGGYFGGYGPSGNTASTRVLAQGLPSGEPGVIWGSVEMAVQTNGPAPTSTSSLMIGQGSLGRAVLIGGVASDRAGLTASPVSDTLWQLSSRGSGQVKAVAANIDARVMTRLVFKLELVPGGSGTLKLWVKPSHTGTEAVLGTPTLELTGISFNSTVDKVRFHNNGQSRFAADNLVLATTLEALNANLP